MSRDTDGCDEQKLSYFLTASININAAATVLDGGVDGGGWCCRSRIVLDESGLREFKSGSDSETGSMICVH